MGETADRLIAQREASRAAVEEIKANRARIDAAKVETAEANAAAAKARAEKSDVPWTHGSGSALNPVTPGGAGSAAGLTIIAGVLAFFGNMKIDKGFPKAGVRIVAATILLAIIMSLFDKGRLSPVARGLAGLMVLAAVIKYVPVLSNTKGKKNG